MPKTPRKRRNIGDIKLEVEDIALTSQNADAQADDNIFPGLQEYSQEVLDALSKDALVPTPSNFLLYFDRLLENKSSRFKKEVTSILELEDNSGNDTNTLELEKSLKLGFKSIKDILFVAADLYKNISIMNKILKKKKLEIDNSDDNQSVVAIVNTLEHDMNKLSSIFTKQIDSLKTMYDKTAGIVKKVENETIFDNQFGLYNKRYFFSKLEQEMSLIGEFKHKSSIIAVELSRLLTKNKDKIGKNTLSLMTKTIARLLLKTSRRSDIVAHYGNGVFVMLLKYTDISSAVKASQRLIDLVQNSNFFVADKEINLSVIIGIAPVITTKTSEEIVVEALKAMDTAHGDTREDYAVSPLAAKEQ